jgi:cyclomaltodextrinase
MPNWTSEAVFYHIYPLGLCGAPTRNNFAMAPSPRLEQIYPWLDTIQALGANTIYFGPLFESTAHGYDTADYYHVDRRLGTDDTLRYLSAEIHARGMRLVLDGVFNHVGRDFWAFRDLQTYGERSAYRDWFCGLRFDQRSPYNDPFSYDGWNGHYDLVKLNLNNLAVREHLFGAVESWVREFGIDGLRLDTADCLDFDFLKALSAFCRRLRPDFWLMGEVIHGDYRRWTNPEMLDSVTNYECYKGLYSSFNDRNFYEIAYTLNRQSGTDGLYQHLHLYTFADNHDVNRVGSSLTNPAHLFPLYALLFSMPGIPSIYYGSEWGIGGKKTGNSDGPLRPHLNLTELSRSAPQPHLPSALARLNRVRRQSAALRAGSYQPLHVSAEQLIFMRQAGDERVIVAINASDQPVQIQLHLPGWHDIPLTDLLNPGDEVAVQSGNCTMELYPCWARIFRMS